MEGNIWISSESVLISLHENIDFYPQHFDLHLKEMEELININQLSA
jgi:hypothetical protein